MTVSKSATQWMWNAIETDRKDKEEGTCGCFPLKFLSSVRVALEAGLTAEQIVSMIVLVTGLYEALEDMDGDELIERSAYIVATIRSDSDYQRHRLDMEKRHGTKARKKARVKKGKKPSGLG